MPYKNKEDIRECDRRWYKNNSEYRVQLNRNWRKKRREWFNDYKSTLTCTICGESDPSCLCFHHVDMSTKEVNIASVASDWGEKRLMNEISKCVVLCVNCHMKIHSGTLELPV